MKKSFILNISLITRKLLLLFILFLGFINANAANNTSHLKKTSYDATNLKAAFHVLKMRIESERDSLKKINNACNEMDTKEEIERKVEELDKLYTQSLSFSNSFNERLRKDEKNMSQLDTIRSELVKIRQNSNENLNIICNASKENTPNIANIKKAAKETQLATEKSKNLLSKMKEISRELYDSLSNTQTLLKNEFKKPVEENIFGWEKKCRSSGVPFERQVLLDMIPEKHLEIKIRYLQARKLLAYAEEKNYKHSDIYQARFKGYSSFVNKDTPLYNKYLECEKRHNYLSKKCDKLNAELHPKVRERYNKYLKLVVGFSELRKEQMTRVKNSVKSMGENVAMIYAHIIDADQCMGKIDLNKTTSINTSEVPAVSPAFCTCSTSSIEVGQYEKESDCLNDQKIWAGDLVTWSQKNGGTCFRCPEEDVDCGKTLASNPEIENQPEYISGTIWEVWGPIPYGYGTKCFTSQDISLRMKPGTRKDKDGWLGSKGGGTMRPTGQSCRKLLDSQTNISKTKQQEIIQSKVSDIVGMSKKEAESKLKNIGLKTKIAFGDPAPTKKDGLKVQKSIPKAGMEIKRGGTVTLVVHPPYVDKRTVPSLVGDTENEVIKKIKKAGLIPRIKTVKASSSAQSGKVSTVKPSSGTEVIAGSTIFVDVFDTYIEKIVVPDLIGMGIKQASNKIKTLGLKSKFKLGAKTDDPGKHKTVTKQEPRAGTKVSKGTNIKLFVSRYVSPKIVGTKIPDQPSQVTGTLWDVWGPIPYGYGKKCFTKVEVTERMKPGARPDKNGWYANKKGGTMKPTGKSCTKPGETQKPPGAGGTIVFSDDVGDFNAGKVIKVPNVIGLSIREASEIIKSAGLEPALKLGAKTNDPGKNKTVFKQNPTPGTKIKPGGKVKMSVYTLKRSSRQSTNKTKSTDKQVYCALGKSTFIYDSNIDYYVFRSYEIKENRRHFRRDYKIFGDYNKRSLQRAQKIQTDGKMEFIMKAPLKELCPHLKKNCHASEEPFVGDLCGKLDGSVIPSSGTNIEEIEETNPGGKSITTEAKCTNYNRCLTDMMQEIQQVSLNMASGQSSNFGCKYLGLGDAIAKVAQDANSAGCTIAGNYAHTGDMIKATAGQMCAGQAIAFDMNKFTSCGNIGKNLTNDGKANGSTIVFSDSIDDFNVGKVTKVPNVVGLSIRKASDSIKSTGLKSSFKLGTKTDDPGKDKTVSKQEPRAGTKVSAGTKVKLFVSRYVAQKVEKSQTQDQPSKITGTLWDWWGPIPYGYGKKCLTHAEVTEHMKPGVEPGKGGWYTRNKGGTMKPTGKSCVKPDNSIRKTRKKIVNPQENEEKYPLPGGVPHLDIPRKILGFPLTETYFLSEWNVSKTFKGGHLSRPLSSDIDSWLLKEMGTHMVSFTYEVSNVNAVKPFGMVLVFFWLEPNDPIMQNKMQNYMKPLCTKRNMYIREVENNKKEVVRKDLTVYSPNTWSGIYISMPQPLFGQEDSLIKTMTDLLIQLEPYAKHCN